jgi:predicted ABC-type ATPase
MGAGFQVVSPTKVSVRFERFEPRVAPRGSTTEGFGFQVVSPTKVSGQAAQPPRGSVSRWFPRRRCRGRRLNHRGVRFPGGFDSAQPPHPRPEHPAFVYQGRKGASLNNIQAGLHFFMFTREQQQKKLYIIAGCNGAGKTTASFTILPDILDCKEFVNADEIARGLSPFQPEHVQFEAGRIMLHRIDSLLTEGVNIAFETTLATKSYKTRILHAKSIGYTVTLLFFWLRTVDLAKERVKMRVAEGGHHIEPSVIERRYHRGIFNLFSLYIPLVDDVLIFDNSFGKYELLAEKQRNGIFSIWNSQGFNALKTIYDAL